MLLRYMLIIFLIVLAARLQAADCDSSGAVPILTSADFPNANCSFNSLGIDPQNLRFGRLTFGGAGGSFFSDPFVNLGSRLYRLDDDVEIFDARNQGDDCDLNDDDDDISFFESGESIAFILSGDSLNAPRVITHMWFLNCNIDSTR